MFDLMYDMCNFTSWCASKFRYWLIVSYREVAVNSVESLRNNDCVVGYYNREEVLVCWRIFTYWDAEWKLLLGFVVVYVCNDIDRSCCSRVWWNLASRSEVLGYFNREEVLVCRRIFTYWDAKWKLLLALCSCVCV